MKVSECHSEVAYRRARRDDLPFMVRAERLSFKGDERFSERTIAHYVRNPHGSVILDIILFQQEAVGYAVFFTRKGSGSVYLQSICILPEMSGRGIASRYLGKRLEEFRSAFSGAHLRYREGNVAARELYRSLGFEVTGRERGYYPDGEDAVTMRLVF